MVTQYLLEHRRNILEMNGESRDAGYVPCGIWESRQQAKAIADINTPPRTPETVADDNDWNDFDWNDGRVASLRYYCENGHTNVWRVVDVSNEFHLKYDDGLW